MHVTGRATEWSLIVIATVLVFAALDTAQDIFAPIVLALVAGVVLSPVTETLDRMGLPHAVAALTSFLTGMAVIVILIMLAQPVVMRTVDAFPSVWREVNSAMYTMKGELRDLREISSDLQTMADPDAVPEEGDPAAAVKRDTDEGEQAEKRDSGESAIPSVEDVIFMAPTIAGQILIFIGALFFFILTRKEIYAALARKLARPGHRDEAALRLRYAERQVARYFLTISMINVGLGVCVAAGMALIGMPSPVIWGALAFFMNFFLYVGPTGLAVVFLIAGITVFDGLEVLLPVAVYLGINMMEAQFVTPSLVGRQLSVNPLLVFLSLVLFMWLWGPMGAIVAIPLLVWGMVLTADIRDLRRAEAERLARESEAEPT